MGSGGQRRLLVLLLAAASLLWVPGQGQPRGERGGGGVRAACRAIQGRAEFVCRSWRRPGAGFRSRGARGALAACLQTPPGRAGAGAVLGCKENPRKKAGGGRPPRGPAVLSSSLPRSSLRPPPLLYFSSSPPSSRFAAAPPPPPLSWSPFFSLGGGGPLRPAASGASHSLCGSRETLRSGRNPGEGAAPAARPLPRSLGRGGGLAGGPGRRGGAPSAAPAPAGDGAAALGVPLRGREGSRQTRRMPHAVANVNRMKLC